MKPVRTAVSEYGIYIVLLLGFFLRVLFLLRELDLPIKWDEQAYFHLAQTILQDFTHYRDLFRPPLYPALVAFSFWFGGVGRFSIGIVQALLSTLSIALVYAIARQRFHRLDVALLAAFLSAVYLEFITLTRLYLTETLFITLLLGGVVLLLRATRLRHARLFFAAGIVLALAALSREIVIYFVLVLVPLWLLIALTPRRAIIPIATFLIGTILVLAPWVARNYALEGRFILVGNSGEYTLLRDTLRAERQILKIRPALSTKKEARHALLAVPPAERSRYVYARVAEIIRRMPIEWIALRTTKIRVLWRPSSLEHRTIRIELGSGSLELWIRQVLGYIPVVLMLLIVVGAFASKDDSAKLLILLFVLYTIVIVFLTHFQPRFRVPLLAIGLADAAFGVVKLMESARHPHTLRISSKPIRLSLGIIVLALFLFLAFYRGN